ncbi:putative quinol monooxygenase [Modestobacter lacusdianchii]
MARVVLATWRAQPEHVERVAELLRQLTPLSRAEPGCRHYQAQTSPDEPGTFLVYEVYDDDAAVDAHRASPHFQELAAGQAIPLLAERSVRTYETLPER